VGIADLLCSGKLLIFISSPRRLKVVYRCDQPPRTREPVTWPRRGR